MKTDDLVTMLATGVQPVDANAQARRDFGLLAVGLVASSLLTVAWLGFNPALARYVRSPMFWVREAFCAASAAVGIYAVLRLSRPGVRTRAVPLLLAMPIVGLWVLAGAVLATTGSGSRLPLVLGSSWAECSSCIAVVSLPALAAVFWLMRGLAPTRLRAAGAVAGFAAGAIGATTYTLHCPELEAPFLAVWYVLGMLLPAAAGALAGPRLLRW